MCCQMKIELALWRTHLGLGRFSQYGPRPDVGNDTTEIYWVCAMTIKRNDKNDAFEGTHSSTNAFHRVGAISKTTLREFDKVCLTTANDRGASNYAKVQTTD